MWIVQKLEVKILHTNVTVKSTVCVCLLHCIVVHAADTWEFINESKNGEFHIMACQKRLP